MRSEMVFGVVMVAEVVTLVDIDNGVNKHQIVPADKREMMSANTLHSHNASTEWNVPMLPWQQWI